MLDAIFDDVSSVDYVKDHTNFCTKFDLEAFNQQRNELVEKWKTVEDKERFRNKIEIFFKQNNLPDQNTDEYRGAKNYDLLKKEVTERLAHPDPLQIITIDSALAHNELINIAESLENTEEIRKIYRLRKFTTGDSKNAGINGDEADRLRSCVRQGRELFLSGRHGDLMAKPLNFFYSVTAYSFATAILNNPTRYSLDSMRGSHGINFVMDKMEVQFGGGVAVGTFSELFSAFPTSVIKNHDTEIIQDNTESIIAFYNSKMCATTGTLLSMIPEIRQYYKIIAKKRGRTHPLTISQSRASTWNFEIGDGEVRAENDDLAQAFPDCKIEERNGKHSVAVPSNKLHSIRACLHADASGQFWYIENPFFPVVLPNFCINFLLTNMFSNVMRYSPDRWGTILLNEANHDCSLIVRAYLSSLEQSFLVSVLRLVSKFYPITSR